MTNLRKMEMVRIKEIENILRNQRKIFTYTRDEEETKLMKYY